MPPLRERADIRDVIDAVFDEEAQMAGHVLTLDAQLAERLARFAWPGNIRQLRNVLRYACAICDGARVELRHVAPDIAALLAPENTHKPALLRIEPHEGRQRDQDPREERARIIDALTRHQWRPNAAAQALGISRATLYRRIATLGIVGPHRR